MRPWRNLDYVLREITARMVDSGLSPQERLWYNNLHNRLIYHEIDVEDALIEAKNIGVRNPAFPDDLVGWLDDDFDDPDDEEDDDETD